MSGVKREHVSKRYGDGSVSAEVIRTRRGILDSEEVA